VQEPDATPATPCKKRQLAGFTGAALIGFAVSALVLHLGLEAGLKPWAARLLALACAMNVTFLVNSRFVFRAPEGHSVLGLWAAYMANSAFGNSCNYVVFVTLSATHWPIVGNPYVALFEGSLAAWAINFVGCRIMVFGGGAQRLVERCRATLVSPRSRPCVPEPAEPGSSPR
jgi:putative flippase GtrA